MSQELVALTPGGDPGRQRLKEMEAEIGDARRKGFDALLQLGRALTVIHQEKLYRHIPGFPHLTFEQYCWERHGLVRSRAYQAMDAAAISAATSTFVDIPIKSEFVAREFRTVLRERGASGVTEAWGKVIEQLPKEAAAGPSAREVRKVLTDTGYRVNPLRAASGQHNREILLGQAGEKLDASRRRLKWYVDKNLGGKPLGKRGQEKAAEYVEWLDAMLAVMQALAAGEVPSGEEL